MNLIPFCTHKELLQLKAEYIKALGIITAQATEINYQAIKEIEGFNYQGRIEDINHVSLKKIDRIDINTSQIAQKYKISQSTVKNMLQRLKELSEIYYFQQQPYKLISIEKTKKGTSYWINHKAYQKYYTLIDREVLEELLLLPANALKLYLVIKYHYENSFATNKPCIIDMKYLCKSIGLKESSRNKVSEILFEMNNNFIKIKRKTNHKLVYNNENQLVNAIKTEYIYEVVR